MATEAAEQPQRSPRRCLLFDLDLTLMVSDGAGSAAMRRAFASEAGASAALAQLGNAFQGRTDGWILREIARRSGAPERALRRRYEREYPRLLREELSARHPRILPGVRELLEALRGRDDVAFCLATGNLREGAFAKLAHVGLDRFFDGGGFGDQHLERSQMLQDAVAAIDQRPGEPVVVIGDSEHDVRGAHDVGAFAVGVATGNRSTAQLEDAGADAVLRDLGDLDRALQALLGVGQGR